MANLDDLPAPQDDGGAAHLPERSLPALELPSTDGGPVRLDALRSQAVVFVHPGIGGPDDEGLLAEWTEIPGARGCTPEACGFRDELARFDALGASVLGLSSQDGERQRQAVADLALPYPLVSDASLTLADALQLPTFQFHGARHYKRLTLIVADGTIAAALYPVFPPDQAAEQALDWLASNAAAGQ